jgi:hypothetical protein
MTNPLSFFKEGLRDSTLIHKLTTKICKSSEEMLAITNKYALAKQATLDSREANNNDKKGKHDHSVADVERPQCNRTEHRP